MRVKKNVITFWGSILKTAQHNKEGKVVGFTKLTKELGDLKADLKGAVYHNKEALAEARTSIKIGLLPVPHQQGLG